MCLITHFFHNIAHIQNVHAQYTSFFLLSPWDVIACLTFRGRLIYETHACFFMTCLIAFSAIGHSGCQNHKNSHLHRIAGESGRAWGSRWSEVFDFPWSAPAYNTDQNWHRGVIDVHYIFAQASFCGLVWVYGYGTYFRGESHEGELLMSMLFFCLVHIFSKDKLHNIHIVGITNKCTLFFFLTFEMKTDF